MVAVNRDDHSPGMDRSDDHLMATVDRIRRVESIDSMPEVNRVQ